MKKILFLFIILFSSLAFADNDDTFHTARIGDNDTYFNSWAGNNDFGNFFDKGFLTLQEEILEDIQWFNTALFRTNTLGGAISHLLLLAVIISLVSIAEVSINPAFMLLAGMGIFFFSWLVILSVSILMGYFLISFGTMYIIRIPTVMRKE